MLAEAFVGEKCNLCLRPFRPGETMNLTGKTKTCRPGIGCTQQHLENKGVRGLKSSGTTGMLTEQFHQPKTT